MHYYALIPLSSFVYLGYFALVVFFCFMGHVKSFQKGEFWLLKSKILNAFLILVLCSVIKYLSR